MCMGTGICGAPAAVFVKHVFVLLCVSAVLAAMFTQRTVCACAILCVPQAASVHPKRCSRCEDGPETARGTSRRMAATPNCSVVDVPTRSGESTAARRGGSTATTTLSACGVARAYRRVIVEQCLGTTAATGSRARLAAPDQPGGRPARGDDAVAVWGRARAGLRHAAVRGHDSRAAGCGASM